jgi:hypothetical protein
MSIRKSTVLLFALLLAATLVLPVGATANGPTPGISPDTVDLVLFPGQSSDGITKTVTTPEIPPGVEVCLLQDETGSFIDDIDNLQAGTTASDIYDAVVAGAPGAKFAVAGFRDYPESPYGSPGDWVYRLLSGMSEAEADWLAGIAALTAGGGNDIPEAQYDAIVAAVLGGFTEQSCGFGTADDVTRVLLVTTDAPFHLPGSGKPHVNTQASTITALSDADVVVVGLKAPGAGGELDALASATGGSVQPLSPDGANIAAAILAGLSAVDVDVEMASDCAAPITTAFEPLTVTVESGDDAVFTETISVAADAPGGTYTCKDWALIDGSPLTYPDSPEYIYETKTIKVPEGYLTGGGQIGRGSRGSNFGGNVGYLADFSIVGQWQFQGVSGGATVKMHSMSIDVLQFSNNALEPPYPPDANANVADFSGTARVMVDNGTWMEGCTFQAHAEDHGEPAKKGDSDAFGISIDCGTGGLWAFAPEDLDAGNLQIHSGLKG